MADMTMKEFLEYHLAFVREHLVRLADTTPQDFYDGGQDWNALNGRAACAVVTLGETQLVVKVADLAHSWGCLEGAAAMADMTIVELLDQHGLQLNAVPSKRSKSFSRAKDGRYYIRIKTAPHQHWTVPVGWHWNDLDEAKAGARKADAQWMVVELMDKHTGRKISYKEARRG